MGSNSFEPETTRERLAVMETSVDFMRKEIDRKFDAVDKRFDKLEDRFDALDEKLDAKPQSTDDWISKLIRENPKLVVVIIVLILGMGGVPGVASFIKSMGL